MERACEDVSICTDTAGDGVGRHYDEIMTYIRILLGMLPPVEPLVPACVTAECVGMTRGERVDHAVIVDERAHLCHVARSEC